MSCTIDNTRTLERASASTKYRRSNVFHLHHNWVGLQLARRVRRDASHSLQVQMTNVLYHVAKAVQKQSSTAYRNIRTQPHETLIQLCVLCNETTIAQTPLGTVPKELTSIHQTAKTTYVRAAHSRTHSDKCRARFLIEIHMFYTTIWTAARTTCIRCWLVWNSVNWLLVGPSGVLWNHP